MADGVRTRESIDLFAILLASTLLVVVLFVLPGVLWLRIALGLPFVLFFPGYALVAALFPRGGRPAAPPAGQTQPDVPGTPTATGGLGALERVALSLGLSIAVVPLLGLALNYTPWGIRLVPVVLTVYAFTVLLGVVALARRTRLPLLARPEFVIRTPRLDWRALAPLDRALVIGAIVAVLLAAGATAYVVVAPRPGESFTEFYVLGPGGKAEGYPTQLAADQNATVLVGIVDHEHAAVQYRLVVSRIPVTFAPNATGAFVPTEGTPVVLSNATITLTDGETHEAPLTFSVPTTGAWKLQLDLQKDGAAASYRTLHLWVNAPTTTT